MLEAANGKPIIFMPARHDHHRVQTGDGYAAYVAGQVVGAPVGVTTDEQASWWGGKGVGTVPHSLIASYGGNTVLAATRFAEWAPEDLNVTVLVDFENDSVRTALEVARALGPRLWGVRLDTSGEPRRPLALGGDGRLQADRRQRAARAEGADALDTDGFEHVKIVASGGFTVDKILEFERNEVPVDAYGVGSSLIRGQNDFTADVGHDRRPPVGEGRPPLPAEPASRACHLGRFPRPPPRCDRIGELRARGCQLCDESERRVVLWDVDTQVDFMLPDREALRPGRGGDGARRCRGSSTRPARPEIVHVASADDHELTDPEISDEPDFRSTRIRRTACAGRAAPRRSPRPSRPIRFPFSLVPYPPGLVPGARPGHREILLLKKNFNVFTNPNTEPLLDALDPAEIVVFGVATDVCDDAAIRGFLLRGRRVRFVEDAARGLDEERTKACLAAWREAGVEFTTADDVVASFA